MIVDFTPRLKKPEKGNKYYIKKPNGYNPCMLGDPRDKNCNVLANCVGYCTARFSEETNEGCCRWFGNMDAKSFPIVAKRDYNLETGQIPKVGAIACWSGGSDGKGHIASVEEVYSNTKYLSSESQYKHFIFKNKTRSKGKDGRWGMAKTYKFECFIYNPHILEVEMTKPVERNTEIDQLEVIKSKLRVRTQPSLNGKILGFAELGYYNDLETCEADNYIWHKIDNDNWIAQVDGYVELLPSLKVGDIVKLKEPITKYKITNIENNKVSIMPITDLDNLEKIS